MATGVQDRDDDNAIGNDSEDDAVGKAVDKGLAELSFQAGKAEGMTRNPRQGIFHAKEEVRCQVRLALAIPSLRLGHVMLGPGEQFDEAGHFESRRCLTSGQVDAVMVPVS